MKPIGLGSTNSNINFYIANRPPIDDYPVMNELRGLATGDPPPKKWTPSFLS